MLNFDFYLRFDFEFTHLTKILATPRENNFKLYLFLTMFKKRKFTKQLIRMPYKQNFLSCI